MTTLCNWSGQIWLGGKVYSIQFCGYEGKGIPEKLYSSTFPPEVYMYGKGKVDVKCSYTGSLTYLKIESDVILDRSKLSSVDSCLILVLDKTTATSKLYLDVARTSTLGLDALINPLAEVVAKASVCPSGKPSKCQRSCFKPEDFKSCWREVFMDELGKTVL
jgi:hypothetical protein